MMREGGRAVGSPAPSDPFRLDWIGALAQLVERLLCKQEVTGSIPVGSTRRFADCSEKGEPFSVHSVSFGCSLKIRKKQGGSGHLSRAGLTG